MIKKITFLFIVLFALLLFCNLKAQANSIIELPCEYVQIGIGDDSILQEQNLNYVSGFVDWKKEGTYTITYNDRLNNIYKKNIIVISDEKEQFFLTSKEEQVINFNNIEEVQDVFYINETSYYIISNYQQPDQSYFDQEKVSVTYYENNQYKWEYRYHKYSRYFKAILNNDNLIVSGMVYNENNNYIQSIVLFEITKNRQIIKSREITSSQSCFIHGIHLFENILFLVTSTSGNGYDYENYKNDYVHRLVILKLNYETFNIIDGVAEDSLEDFMIVDTSFYNTRIAINILHKNNIIVNNYVITNTIFEYNDNLELYKKYDFNTQNKDYLGFVITVKDVCIFSIDHSISKYCVNLQYLNDGVYNKNVLFDLENQYNINNIQEIIVNNNDIYFCMKYQSTTDNQFLGFCKVNSDQGIKYYSRTIDSVNVFNSKINNGYIINTYKKDKKIYYKSYNLIEIFTKDYQYNEKEETKKHVIVNGISTKNDQYISNVNENIFGNYININKKIDHFNNKYYLSDSTYIPLNCNVLSDEIYQTNFKLQFNGVGFLNGKAIESNYVINDIGKYLLEIEGENTEKILISFEIDNLTLDNSFSEEVNLKIENVGVTNKTLEEKHTINTQCSFIVDKNYHNIIPLIISILSFSILGMILLRKKI